MVVFLQAGGGKQGAGRQGGGSSRRASQYKGHSPACARGRRGGHSAAQLAASWGPTHPHTPTHPPPHLQELPLFDWPLHGPRWQACRRRGIRFRLGPRLPQLPARTQTSTREHGVQRPLLQAPSNHSAGGRTQQHTVPCNHMQRNLKEAGQQAHKAAGAQQAVRTCRGQYGSAPGPSRPRTAPPHLPHLQCQSRPHHPLGRPAVQVGRQRQYREQCAEVSAVLRGARGAGSQATMW